MDSTGRTPSRIYIAMATFNGARFLAAQIESIQAQTVDDWTLLVRDDGSTDGTAALLESCAAADRRIEVVADDAGNLGPIGNFSRLAALAYHHGADWLFLADQDDIWFPDKLARMLETMHETERQAGHGVPVLVHSDLQLVDADGAMIHRSFMEFQRIRHEGKDALAMLLVQNFVTGCASALNRPLLALAVPIPADALMHDWWFALCTAADGTVAFLAEATVAYRRHGSNTVTVRGFWRTVNPLKTDWAQVWRQSARNHARALRQAAVLLERLHERHAGSDAAGRTAAAFVGLHRERSPLTRIVRAVQLGLRSQTLPRTIALYLRLVGWAA